jgi:hypothetical protein
MTACSGPVPRPSNSLRSCTPAGSERDPSVEFAEQIPEAVAGIKCRSNPAGISLRWINGADSAVNQGGSSQTVPVMSPACIYGVEFVQSGNA